MNKIFCNIKSNPLRNSNERLKFARHIQSITNYFSVQEILVFIQEMDGLDLKKPDDQVTFMEFLNCWMHTEGRP